MKLCILITTPAERQKKDCVALQEKVVEITMTEQELRELIASGENMQTEFEREIDNASDIAAEIVAFANGEGGLLLL